jgi:hypothetical protein
MPERINLRKERFESLVSSFDERPEELESANDQKIVPIPILVCLSQPDEPAFRRVRHRKPCNPPVALGLGAVRIPMNFCPMDKVQRTLNDTRSEPVTDDCVMSRADAHFMEIPANLLAWLGL